MFAEGNKADSKRVTVLLVDEMDLLITKKQQVSSLLICIMISCRRISVGSKNETCDDKRPGLQHHSIRQVSFGK